MPAPAPMSFSNWRFYRTYKELKLRHTSSKLPLPFGFYRTYKELKRTILGLAFRHWLTFLSYL